MPKIEWVKDMNFNIVEDTRHWTERPWRADPTSDVHPQWRRNTSDNILMNLFQTLPVDGNDTADTPTTFAQYYGKDPNTGNPYPGALNIAGTLAKFAARMEYIPREEKFNRKYQDENERARLTDRRLDLAKHILERAAETARHRSLDNMYMADLYLDSFYNIGDPAKKKLEKVLDQLKWFQDTVQWACLPFLKFKLNANDPIGLIRPTLAAYKDHLEGDSNAGMPPGTTPSTVDIIGVKDYTFKDFLFFAPSGNNTYTKYLATRKHATYWGFLDSEHVDQRVEREERLALAIANGSDESEISKYQIKSDYGVLANSNGYRCVVDGGVRKCVPGVPADYCVNNGSSTCS
jgi:hypothetical protein